MKMAMYRPCKNAMIRSIGRARLCHGRSNVTTDLAESPEPYWRGHFARLQGRLDSGASDKHRAILRTAWAMKMEAGFCGEHAQVAIAEHAEKLAIGETIYYAANTKEDHGWSEVKLPNGKRIIIDPWAEGPAIMAEDNALDPNMTLLEFNSKDGKIFSRLTANCLKRFNEDKKSERRWEEYRKNCAKKRKNIRKSATRLPTSVFHENFRTQIAQVRAQRDPEGILEILQKIEVPPEDPLALELKAAINSAVSDRTDIGRSIRAIGAARLLGANILQASSVKEQILDEMDSRIASQAPTENSAHWFRWLSCAGF
jgi:hypothetical protein